MEESASTRPRSPSPPKSSSSQSSPSTSDYPSDPTMHTRVSQPFTSWPHTVDVKSGQPAQSLLLEDVLQEDAFSSSTADHQAAGLAFPDYGVSPLQLYPLAAQPQDGVAAQLTNFHTLGLQSPTAFSPIQSMVKQEPQSDSQMPGLIYPVSQGGSPTDYSTSYFYSTSQAHTPASSESPQPSHAVVEPQLKAEPEVVYPPPTVTGLKIALPTIPQVGAKSRVETQIKVVLQLTMPDGDPLAGRRVGTWKYIKLEKGAALRKRPRGAAKNMPEPKPSEVLQLVATVHPASQPSLTAYRCPSCHQREVKRTARKLALRVRPPLSPSPDGNGNKTRDNSEEELDDKRMVIFNCADLQELRDGEVSLPTRLVCYCRHHREKIGFIVIFKLFAEGGRLVAEGTSPAIMITDDHKTRNPEGGDSSAAMSRMDMSGQFFAPEEVMPKRRRGIDEGADSQPERRPRKKNRSAASTPPTADSLRTSPNHAPHALPLSPLSAISPTANPLLPALAPSIPPTVFPFPQPMANTLPMHQAAAAMVNRPRILRLIPPTGPVAGGIEVTLLGQSFSLTTAPVFGNVAATSWTPYGENAMVCILPPSPCPGPVRVTLQGVEPILGEEPTIFCYEDHSDKALMELALQVVGLKMNGRIDNARDVAMQIMVSGRSVGGESSTIPQGNMPYGQSMYAAARFLGSQASQAAGHDFQSTLMSLMRLLEAPVPSGTANAAYLSRTGPSGLTLLHLAVILNFHRLCGQLLSLGIDPNIRDVNGYTALHFAALHGRVRCARLLIDAGADVGIVQGLGQTAADVARAYDEVDIMELCEEYALDHPDNYDGVDADESAEDGFSDVSLRMSEAGESEGEDEDDEIPRVLRAHPDILSNITSPSALSSSTITGEFDHLPPLPDEADLDLAEPVKESVDAAPPPPYSHWPSSLVDYSAALLQKALLQIQTPQYTTPWEKMPSVVPNVPWEKMTSQLHLPTMPLIFQVSVPSWPPSLLWPGAPTAQEGEKAAAPGQPIATWWQRPDASKTMRASRVPTPSTTIPAAASEVIPASSKNGRRVHYAEDADVTDGELNSFAYQASMDGRRPRRNDRMLVLFWIPILIIVLAWAVIQSLPYAYSAVQASSRLISSRLIAH